MNRKRQGWNRLFIFTAVLKLPLAAGAQGESELARTIENPLAKLVTVPLQNNWDFGIGPREAMKYTLKAQPIVPFALGTNWYILSRTIFPLTYRQAAAPGEHDKSGLEDTSLSLFLSPKRFGPGGLY